MKNMDYEKKYKEALNWMRELYPGLHGATKEDAEHYFPELKENEDERTRKELIELISCMHDADPRKKRWIAWLEKQKEQPQEELVYRLNGLMQEYIKEGEDDAEKEHRLKCYQLFWDALEDADFFEQKEQKPNHDKEKLIKHCIGMILTDATEKRFKDYGLTLKDCLTWLSVQKEQKPITINQDEKEFLADEITAFLCNYDKEFDGEDPVPSEVAEHFYLLGKQAQEQKPVDEQFPPLEGLDAIKAKYYDDGFKNGFDEGVESVKPAEWSKNDTVFLNEIIDFFENKTARPQHDLDMYAHWLKSLPGRLNLQPKNEWSEEDKQNYKVICSIIHGTYVIETQETQDKLLSWLKSLRPQSKGEIHKEKNEKPKHTEVWVEGRTIFEQDANTFVNTEGEPEAKLTGWVARDRNGEICVYGDYPERISAQQFWFGQEGSRILDQKSFPDLKWEDEPIEVELTIKRK